jgi:hypothetical protein
MDIPSQILETMGEDMRLDEQELEQEISSNWMFQYVPNAKNK